MKTSLRHLFLSAALAVFLLPTWIVLAQEQPSSPTAKPAPEQEKAGPTVTPPPEPPKPETAPSEPSKLRRLDEPTTPPDKSSLHKLLRSHAHHNYGNEVVHVGRDAFLAKGDQADAVVAVFGSATSEGEVFDSVVSILGNTRVTGPVGDTAVAVFGNTYVNSKVGDNVVAVFGTVELGPDAEVGDVTAVGGSVKRDPNAIVHGQINNVAFGGLFSDVEWLHSWIVNCALYGRLLAFGPNLMWAWWIALGFLACYAVVALLFSKGIEQCTETLEQRPGYSILAALLTVLLAPVVTILLVITGVGIAVVPFLAAALFFAGLFGKAVMLAWLGRRILRSVAAGQPALAVLVGGVILLFLYTVPILGLVLYKLFGWIGLGVVVYTLILGMKREKPAVPPVMPTTPNAGEPASAPTAIPAEMAPAPTTSAPMTPPLISALSLPRAGFWIRLAALLLDLILVGMILALFFHSPGKSELLVLVAYGAIMWKLRGTTIGGIVCGLKVVRLDGRELDWSTTIVRGLGCLLSFVVIGLGFIWVAFDDQKQAWHDKIAGTTVVRVPKGVSLV